jgi:UDP-galactose transporter B1
MLELGPKGKFALCAGGIFVCYFYYGILQERITRGNYGDERFIYSIALVFSQCLVNYLYAVLMSKTVLDQGEDTTKTSYYMICALSYLVAMVSSNKALMWVNYPTQVIGKSCKPIPVMILGVLIGRKSYPLLKYMFVLMIVAGVALFMYKDKAASKGEESVGLGLGEIMLLLSLSCDGITGAIQERMKSEHKTKSGHMMKAMNLWSMLFLGSALLVTGEGLEFIGFVSRHPAVLWQILTFCVASAFGQFFIFMCVSEFGPLPCSIVTTTRKFFTVLASVVFFGNSLIPRQWFGVALVFAGLFLDGAFGKKKVA